MIIRKYEPADCKQIAELFYNTVHSINAKDYTKEQLDVWATGSVDLEQWNKSFLENFTVVAAQNNIVIGFGDINKDGYLDRLYVHKDYQSESIGTRICDVLERAFAVDKITTHASITARGFFEKRGYKVVKEQKVERQGVLLTNYIMEK